MYGNILSYAYQATTNPSIPNPCVRTQYWNRCAVAWLISKVTPVTPSSGGTGNKLKVPSSKFKRKMMLRNVAANRDRRQNDQCEIRRRTTQRHPGGATRIASLPFRVVRRAGPADHPVRHTIRKDRHNY